ncbi:hypothetical protein GCM10011425_01310 [Mucilaginibacter galii]|uniref:Uncharacterized protein n=2 Tax=Mucilaginibacter galii TaxID=2005073 RepID=A0A917N024_9SPHI|nr:hypothetical protein GCM10011425_01310 [Mucilaginibacter galii]
MLFAAALLSLTACEKKADPTVIKVSTTPITGTGTTTPGTGTTTPGTGTNPGTGTTTPGTGTTTPGTGTTTPGTGTTTPGTGTTTPGTGTTTPGTGTTTPGTVNSNGDGGVPIGAMGTIVFTLKGATYTLSNSSTYLTTAISASSLGFPLSSVTGSPITSDNGIIINLVAFSASAGVTDITTAQLSLADGTSYTGTVSGYINFNTFSVASTKATTKGTFDVILTNDKNSTDKVRLSGSFNL